MYHKLLIFCKWQCDLRMFIVLSYYGQSIRDFNKKYQPIRHLEKEESFSQTARPFDLPLAATHTEKEYIIFLTNTYVTHLYA